MNEFQCHSDKQERALFSENRYLLLASGTQYGKTTVGALRMKMMMHRHTSPDDNFIITSPSYPIMTQSSLPPFLRSMEGYGVHDKKNNCFKMHEGGTCWFRTETDPDSIVGIPNVKHIWADEAGKYRLYFWENIQARADSKGCGIDLTTSPYSLNWVWSQIMKPWKKGDLLGDWKVIQAPSWENPYHSLHNPKARAEKRATMDPRRFNMIYGGEFGRMEGLVYDCWEDEENFVEPFALPPGTRFFGEIDWGYYPDPWTLGIRALLPDGTQIGVSEYVKCRDTITDIVRVCQEKRTVWPIELFVADPSQPGYIEEMNRARLPTIGGNNDIKLGIDEHYQLIKTRRYKEFRGACPSAVDERETYHYPEAKDLRPDEDKKETVPVDQFNHRMDPQRYLTMHLKNLTMGKNPKVPVGTRKRMTESEFIRRPSHTPQTETWSKD